MTSKKTPYIRPANDVSDGSFRLGNAAENGDSGKLREHPAAENGDSGKLREHPIAHGEIWINNLFYGQEVYMINERGRLHGAVDICGENHSEADWITNKLLCNGEATCQSDRQSAKMMRLKRHQQDQEEGSTFREDPPCSGEGHLFGASLHGIVHSGEDEKPLKVAIGEEGLWAPNCYLGEVQESMQTFMAHSSESKSLQTAWNVGDLWWEGLSKACCNENQRVFTTDQNILQLENIEPCEFPEGIWLEHVVGKNFMEDAGVPKGHDVSANCSVASLLWGTVVQQMHGSSTNVWRQEGEVFNKEEIKVDARSLKGHGSSDNHAVGSLPMGTVFQQMHANGTDIWSGGTEVAKEEVKFWAVDFPQLRREEMQWFNDGNAKKVDLINYWGEEQGRQQDGVYHHNGNDIVDEAHSCTAKEVHAAEDCIEGKWQGEKVDRKCLESESRLQDLPPYALFYTFSYLNLQDLLTTEVVCKSFRDYVRDDASLWLQLHVEPPLSKRLTDEVLLQLAARAKGQLQCLSLVDCFRVTENAVEQVVRSNPRLFKLCLPGCIRVSAEAVVRMVKEHAAHKAGMVGLTQLRIRNIYGLTREHLDGLLSILGNGLQTEMTSHQPQFYHYGHSAFTCDDQRLIDVEACPKCGNARVVYDCTRDRCQQRQDNTLQQCRGCIFCIARCEECGRCIDDNDYEETFCLDLLCSACWAA